VKTIRELREERGWTQLELAIEVGVTPATVYNWERGRYEPKVSQFRALARAFGVSMDDIELADPGAESPPARDRRRGRPARAGGPTAGPPAQSRGD
jgi:transcriptional regulator with XRE-family HTH domain